MKQREELKTQAVRAEEEIAARREAHAQAKRRSHARMLVHKGVQPCLRSAFQERERGRRVPAERNHDAAAEAVPTRTILVYPHA